MYDFEDFETDLLFEQLSVVDSENINNESNDYLIGTIDFNDSINEGEISTKSHRFKTKSIGECKVEVYSTEGDNPHMHIFNANKTFNSCIFIYTNKYFSHGNKYKDKFSSKQSSEFNEWMKQPNAKIPYLTNWETVKILWEQSNPNCKFDENKKVDVQPDYSKLK